MSVSQPTRNCAYGLLITTVAGDEFLQFPTFELLARGVSQRLDGGIRYGRPRRETVFLTEILCRGTLMRTQNHHRIKVEFNDWGPVSKETYGAWTTFEAFGLSGKLLKIASVLSKGDAFEADISSYQLKLLKASNRNNRLDYCGYGPVPGTRKWRGGYRTMRRIPTTPERRLNALVIKEDGEVAVRGARRGHNLPSTYDDICRQNQRSWKSQSKGKKSWDRS